MGRGDPPNPDPTREDSALIAFLDTNVPIRHLTGDPPEMAIRATAVLGIYEVDALDFADAHLVAQAQTGGVSQIVPFDRSIDRVGTVVRREP